MRLALAVLAAALVSGVPGAVLAQLPGASAPSTDPRLWVVDPEATIHAASGAVCLSRIEGFEPLMFMGPQAANLLGTCTYTDAGGAGNAGLRVRQYEPGFGETREIIVNDRALMEPDPAQGPPLFAARMAPVTTANGTKGGLLTITKTRNGYLIDCYAEGAMLADASAKIARFCGN
jgi:hypothetical protein